MAALPLPTRIRTLVHQRDYFKRPLRPQKTEEAPLAIR